MPDSQNNPQGERKTERLYLVIGTEDGLASSVWPESKLHRAVLAALFHEPDDCSQEEAEYWEMQLRGDSNWSWDRSHFHEAIGEVAHLDIYLITDTSSLQSLLDEKHAPSKEVEERIEELSLRCGEDLFDYLDFLPPGEFGNRLRLTYIVKKYLTELATELTKGREEERHNAQLIAEERDRLDQQLAEASERLLLFEKLSVERGREIETIRAQNIALSAVVEKMREALKWAPCKCAMIGSNCLRCEVLDLQPDLSLYGKCIAAAKIANEEMHDCGCSGGSFIYGCTHQVRRLRQLLADLGQSK